MGACAKTGNAASSIFASVGRHWILVRPCIAAIFPKFGENPMRIIRFSRQIAARGCPKLTPLSVWENGCPSRINLSLLGERLSKAHPLSLWERGEGEGGSFSPSGCWSTDPRFFQFPRLPLSTCRSALSTRLYAPPCYLRPVQVSREVFGHPEGREDRGQGSGDRDEG